jgi:methionyl-tRNA formyltransferase
MNVLLVAEESAGIQVLKYLAKIGHRVVAVMCAPPANGSPNATVHSVAKQFGYPTWPAKDVKNPALAHTIRAEKVDILLNIHSLYIIHGDVLLAPRLGSFNMHTGPLPRYAGLNAPSWALLHGEKQHGVTIHRMVPGIDAGPIAYQALFDIEEIDTGLTVSLKCVRNGLVLIERLLTEASTNPEGIPSRAQDLSQRTYFGKEVPREGWVPWASPANSIVNFVRAFDYFPFKSPWGNPKALLDGHEVGIAKVFRTPEPCTAAPGTVGRTDEAGALVAAADEWVRVVRVSRGGIYSDAATMLKCGDHLVDGFGKTGELPP